MMVVLQINLMGIHREEKGLIFDRLERKTPALRPVLQSN